jgi:hypothetical protein
MRWLRHAFALDPEKPEEIPPEQREVAQKICREVVRRRMTTPALMMLELSRPLGYLGAQAMHFFAPIASVLVNPGQYEQFALLLERRDAIEYLCRQLESLEAQYDRSGPIDAATEDGPVPPSAPDRAEP